MAVPWIADERSPSPFFTRHSAEAMPAYTPRG